MSGVRSSWLTLLKNAVLARSRSVKFFGTFLLRFISLCVGDAGGNLAGSQVEEAGIARVKLTVGFSAAMKMPAGFSWPRVKSGNQARLDLGGLSQTSGRQVREAVAQIVEGHGTIGVEENVDRPRRC